ncbi:baseplate assembly protein [Enterobacter ludwigii]|uniref:baseplate assembly protein n=1 Tax=Enterobacter ludwigii TaxID=299767 RepID=UPI002A80D214|nr:baseplate J/gp47 family protein [Enterobacter ludwigii]
MAGSYDVINLSTLPVPDAIVMPDALTIFSAWLARLRELDPDFDALVESDPTFKQGEVTAYQLTLAFQRVNDAVRAVFLASATNTDLDQIGAAFNVERMVIVPANPDSVPPTDAIMEEDDAFRERIQLSWSQLNTAGARNAYRFHARSADENVLDADAYGPEDHGRPGEVDVYVLSRQGNGTADDALLGKVSAQLNADDIRPLTDFVTVKSAVIREYTVTAELEIPDGPDAGEVLEHAKNILSSYTLLANRIHAMVPVSAIYAALQQTGVARVILSHPQADIEAALGTAPRCAAINVTRKGA